MKIFKYLLHPSRVIIILMNKNAMWFLPDKIYIKIKYKLSTGKKLDLINPLTFNEKLQWLKLYDRKKVYSKMVDKYEVKKYVVDIIGKEYIIPTIGIYDSFDEIDFDKLPNQFVIKCTHDSGGIIIVKDKTELDIELARKKIKKFLKRKYYYVHREWIYKNVKPRIIIEKYMEDKKTNELRDYKFFCFNGKVKCFKIDFNRSTIHQANYYDEKGVLLNFGEKVCPPDFNANLQLPKNLKKMIEFAEELSKNNSFLRVDFYEMDEKIYFGELTFFPAAGFGKFIPENWDNKLGSWLELPKRKIGEEE